MKFLVDLIDISDMGVVRSDSREEVESYVKDSRGDDYELGLEVDGGYEVVDSTGEVVAFIFLVAEDVAERGAW